MTLKDIRLRNSTRVNRLRRVQRLLETELFAFAWNAANDAKRKEVDGWIYLGNISLIEKWVNESRKQDLEIMSLRQLRSRASAVGVQYYARLAKSELIWEITNAEESRADRQTPEDSERDDLLVIQVGQNLGEEVQRSVQPS